MAALQGLRTRNVAARVFYLGTFSKATYADIRFGYVVVPEALIDVFEIAQRHMGMLTSITMQDARGRISSSFGRLSRPHQKDDAAHTKDGATACCDGSRPLKPKRVICASKPRPAACNCWRRARAPANDRQLSARLLEAGVVGRPLSSMLITIGSDR